MTMTDSNSQAADQERNLALPIEDLHLTVRPYNRLKGKGILTVGDLVARSEFDLGDIRNLGDKSIGEIKQKLASMGLALSESDNAGLEAYFGPDEMNCLARIGAEMAGGGLDRDDLSKEQVDLATRAWALINS
jgi:hypothetical protein